MKNYPVCKVLIIYYVSKRCNLSMTFKMKIGLVVLMLYVQLIIIQSSQDVSGQGLGSMSIIGSINMGIIFKSIN